MKLATVLALTTLGALLSSNAMPKPLLVLEPPASMPKTIGVAQAKVTEGLAALNRGDISAAELAFKAALALDAKTVGGHLGLAEVAGRRRDDAGVEYWLGKGIKANPNHFGLIQTLGTWLAKKGRFDEAEKQFIAAAKADPESVEATIALGEVYLARNSTIAKAEPAFRKAIKADPRSIPAHIGLARALAGLGKDKEAKTVLDEAVRMAPSDPMPLITSARLSASRGQGDEAIALLQRAIDVAPEFLPAYLDKGDLHMVRKELDRAAETFRAGAANTRQPAAALFRLGVAQQAAQRWDEAERAYLDAIDKDPAVFGAYNNLAFMFAERKTQLDKALALIEKAGEIAPQSATVRDTKGWIFRARGNLKGAAELIEQASKLDPKDPAVQYHLGVVNMELGHKTVAAAAFKKALELGPSYRYADSARDYLKQLGAR